MGLGLLRYLRHRLGLVCHAERLHEHHWWQREDEAECPQESTELTKMVRIYQRLRAQNQTVPAYDQVGGGFRGTGPGRNVPICFPPMAIRRLLCNPGKPPQAQFRARHQEGYLRVFGRE